MKKTFICAHRATRREPAGSRQRCSEKLGVPYWSRGVGASCPARCARSSSPGVTPASIPCIAQIQCHVGDRSSLLLQVANGSTNSSSPLGSRRLAPPPVEQGRARQIIHLDLQACQLRLWPPFGWPPEPFRFLHRLVHAGIVEQIALQRKHCCAALTSLAYASHHWSGYRRVSVGQT